ncbi:MAG TPA: 50S ribosomal protein L15 [Candidatus Diapherotrites archaeon]|uniref:Large ribosomal subunit protein uL15 n=1 Tax=Candidatus Iainarchaeum sp. TaxID=3101447 RepID=A0A7J4J4Q8_9ARCH|nr:50S ribosomal protein L15P [uncultured archaeon]HIH10206.1 50S ribosomal protein L15 [Candidatus Diapherotrites archaeon]
MVVRKRRKKNKVRGNRTHGGGGTKNRRGSGNRGGVGRAGSHKHKFSLYYMDFGVKRTFKAGPKDEAVNLEYVSSKVDEWLTEGKAKKENDTVILDGSALGFDKVLGKGAVSRRIRFENVKASKQAAKKIVAAGGSIPGTQEEFGKEGAEDEEDEGEEE